VPLPCKTGSSNENMELNLWLLFSRLCICIFVLLRHIDNTMFLKLIGPDSFAGAVEVDKYIIRIVLIKNSGFSVVTIF
jgi:hypothetical protein